MSWKNPLLERHMTIIFEEETVDERGCPIIIGSAASRFAKIDFIFNRGGILEDEEDENIIQDCGGRSFQILSFSLKIFEKGSNESMVVNFNNFTNVNNLYDLDKLCFLLGIEYEEYESESSVEPQKHDVGFDISFD